MLDGKKTLFSGMQATGNLDSRELSGGFKELGDDFR